MTDQNAPPTPPTAERFTLSEDWQATLIGLVIIAIIGSGLFEFASIIPWPIIGLFAE